MNTCAKDLGGGDSGLSYSLTRFKGAARWEGNGLWCGGFRSGAIGAEFFRHFLQRGIKLHEGVFDRGVIFVALPARRFRICSSSFCIGVKVEIGPLFGESTFIFYFHTHTDEFTLEMACLVDGTIGFRLPLLDNEDGFVRPLSGGQELTVTPLWNEYVREQLASVGGGGVVHSQPGGKKDPSPVVFRADQTLAGVSRDWIIRLGLGGQRLRLCGRGNETKRKNRAQKDSVFRHFASHRSSRGQVFPSIGDYIANRPAWLVADRHCRSCPIANLAPLPMRHHHD